MSEKMTAIRLPSLPRGTGWAEWGYKEPSEMIAIIRELATIQLQQAQAILAADDADFMVETYKGPYAMRNRVVLQEGKK